MKLTPDHIVLWQWGFFHVNATMLFTWIVMLLLTVSSWLATRQLAVGELPRSRWQNALEVLTEFVRGQIRGICPQRADDFLPFIGTLFLFIAISNLMEIVPGWHAPTGSLSTTAALALCVAVAVPVFGIMRQGLVGYIRHYVSPSAFMVPIHLLSEVTRTVALAVRLFGNIMSGSLIVALLLAIAPLFVPVLLQILGMIIGLIQAYIFSILAMVYIAAAVQSQRGQEGTRNG
jgi:F-type H+-transporting ATPase subunit a